MRRLPPVAAADALMTGFTSSTSTPKPPIFPRYFGEFPTSFCNYSPPSPQAQQKSSSTHTHTWSLSHLLLKLDLVSSGSRSKNRSASDSVQLPQRCSLMMSTAQPRRRLPKSPHPPTPLSEASTPPGLTGQRGRAHATALRSVCGWRRPVTSCLNQRVLTHNWFCSSERGC